MEPHHVTKSPFKRAQNTEKWEARETRKAVQSMDSPKLESWYEGTRKDQKEEGIKEWEENQGNGWGHDDCPVFWLELSLINIALRPPWRVA